MRDYNDEKMKKQLITNAGALIDALQVAITTYEVIIEQKQMPSLEIQRKLAEVSDTGIWAFKKYYDSYSLSNFVKQYFSKGQHHLYDEGAIIQENATLSQNAMRTVCAVLDLPFACVAGLVSGSVKTLQNSALVSKEVVMHKIRSYDHKNVNNHSRIQYVGLMRLQQVKIGDLLKVYPVDCAKLSKCCVQILSDLDCLVHAVSSTTLIVGEDYLTQNLSYAGMRHFVTGASRLADIIERNILLEFNFNDESRYFNDPSFKQYMATPAITLAEVFEQPVQAYKSRNIYPYFNYSYALPEPDNGNKYDGVNDNNSDKNNAL